MTCIGRILCFYTEFCGVKHKEGAIFIKFNSKYFSFLVTLQKIEAQLVIGTPKEVASFVIMRQFNIESVRLLMLDDAEVINTSELVKKNVTDKLGPNSVKIFTSLHSTGLAMRGHCFKILEEHSVPNITKIYIMCNDTVKKIHAIVDVYRLLQTSNAQCIIFCRV